MDLSNFTVIQLRNFATKYEIAGRSKLKLKIDLVNAVNSWLDSHPEEKEKFLDYYSEDISPIIPYSWKFISGPVSFSGHYSPELKKTVYIFGDFHFHVKFCDINSCYTECENYFPNLLDNMFHQYSGEDKIDFFLEIPYLPKDKSFLFTESESVIPSIHDKFDICFLRQKILCPYQNKVRFHYKFSSSLIRFKSGILLCKKNRTSNIGFL